MDPRLFCQCSVACLTGQHEVPDAIDDDGGDMTGGHMWDEMVDVRIEGAISVDRYRAKAIETVALLVAIKSGT